MPRFRVRLQSPIGPLYRVSYVTADTADDAVDICKQIDRDLVAAANQPDYDHAFGLAYVVERGQPVPDVKKWKTQPPEPKGEVHILIAAGFDADGNDISEVEG